MKRTTRQKVPVVRKAVTIAEFCRAWNISVPTFYRWKKQGLAPDVLSIGGVRRITREAEAAWIQKQKGSQ